jgi:hypothetical protein
MVKKYTNIGGAFESDGIEKIYSDKEHTGGRVAFYEQILNKRLESYKEQVGKQGDKERARCKKHKKVMNFESFPDIEYVDTEIENE